MHKANPKPPTPNPQKKKGKKKKKEKKEKKATYIRYLSRLHSTPKTLGQYVNGLSTGQLLRTNTHG